MNADQLLSLYERVAEAPDAIARLRRFVRELAVRGKLMEQDSLDEPVSVVLRRIKVSAALIRAFALPSAWAWVTVGSVAESRLGKMLDKAKNKGVPRPYLRNINVRWFDFDLSNLLAACRT
jgi:type I restriction enzyme, S subunit